MSRFADYRREHLLPIVARITNYSVRSGPFKSLKIAPVFSCSDGAICQKLMGWYEQELHGHIECAIASKPDAVLNWGCADGYYSTGLAMRLPEAASYNVDLCDNAIAVSVANALANGLSHLSFSRDSSTETLSLFLKGHEKPLLFMDVEGAEDDLLNLDAVPELERATIIVEMHDCFRPGVTNRVIERFKRTHRIETIEQTAKNPYIPELSFLPEDDKVMLISDGRAVSMHWLYLSPKD